MRLTLAYHGRSAVTRDPRGMALSLEPNLRRDRVGFEGVLRSPLRFREAIGALHDVVVSDLRQRPKDRSAYKAYLAEQASFEVSVRQLAVKESRRSFYEGQPELPEPYSPDLERKYEKLRNQYWNARLKYSSYLSRHDPELWRLLVPCDPVITVAPDVVFFECFSADESSYGCLTVDRGAFASERDVALGTTNVDYSWSLYEHFQKLRSYRETRFLIDPSGFEVRTAADPSYREEKIDLPPSWLRGFMTMQAAMSLPMRRVPMSREGLYAILAHLNRHRARRSPRAVRFELEPGKPVQVVLEPWERRLVLHDSIYDGPREEHVRTWGRDRLALLARLLPLMEGADVFLLGTGLPSFWSIRMGEMRLLLGLSGWTANDWTGGSALDQLAPPGEPDAALLGRIADAFRDAPSLTLDQVRRWTGGSPADVVAGLNRLARMGQLIHDLPAGVYRWRSIMPVPVSLEQLGPEDPETEASRILVAQRLATVSRDERRNDGLRILEGRVGERPNVSLLLDADGRMIRGKCTCSHHFKGGLRRGPCRHLQALRKAADGPRNSTSLDSWFNAIRAW